MTTIFLVEIDVLGESKLTDMLYPEWGTLRFHDGDLPSAHNHAGHTIAHTSFPVTGPHSIGLQFSIGTSRQWGVTLQPLGWATLIGLPAEQFSNAIVDGHDHAGFERFRPLAQAIYRGTPDEERERKAIVDFLEGLAPYPVPKGERISRIFVGLLNTKVHSVEDLAEASRTSKRTLERVCKRDFGFSPKLLLRRQRFMRSLTKFAVDPSLRWVGAMDGHYHDQAQFVRDFKDFMGMKPSEFAARDKPMLTAAARERDRYTQEIIGRLRREGDMRDYGVREG